jgi:hypothetical protein
MSRRLHDAAQDELQQPTDPGIAPLSLPRLRPAVRPDPLELRITAASLGRYDGPDGARDLLCS